MQRARATASALALLLAAGALGCGASLDDPVPNLEACQTLTVALAAKCGSELQFLNCDMLPGCPGTGESSPSNQPYMAASRLPSGRSTMERQNRGPGAAACPMPGTASGT